LEVLLAKEHYYSTRPDRDFINNVVVVEKKKIALEIQRKMEWKVQPQILDQLQLDVIKMPDPKLLEEAEKRYLTRESFYSGNTLATSSFFLILNPWSRMPFNFFLPSFPFVTFFFILDRFNSDYSDMELSAAYVSAIFVPVMLYIVVRSSIIYNRFPGMNELKDKLIDNFNKTPLSKQDIERMKKRNEKFKKKEENKNK